MPNKIKRKRISPDELEFIRKNSMVMADAEIAEILHRDEDTIKTHRVRLGIIKGRGGRVENIIQDKTGVIEEPRTASINLTEDQRKSFYQAQFESSLYYKTIQQQFTKEEIDFYLEEWGALCVQFEDIVATEKRQIDSYIKLRIMGNRALRNIKEIEDEIAKLQNEIEEFRLKHGDKLLEDEDLQERDKLLFDLVQIMSGQARSITDNVNKNIDMQSEILEELNARRKDRVDQLSRRGTTFQSIIEELRNRETREKHGRHMELVRLAKEKKKSEWRKPIKFPDGMEDCVLLDEYSIAPNQREHSVVRDRCKLIDKYKGRKDTRVLLIEDDNRRQQFFSEAFDGSLIDYATNATKAIESLKSNSYDLVCLDYDLSLEQKGTEVADFICKNNMIKKFDILVHSMNDDGAKKIVDLIGRDNCESFRFESIVKDWTENATQNT